MNCLEISFPVDVSVPAKLMGSEGFGGGGVRVSSNKADNKCETARVNSSIERCSASISKKGAGSSSGASDTSLWRKLMHSHDFVHDRLTKLRVETSSEPQNGYLPNASPESAEFPRKRGKLSRSSSSNVTSKRTKLILLDDTVNTVRVRENDTKEMCVQGSTSHSDKPLAMKQRSNCSGRRGEKRNSKVPTRTFSNVSVATGENAFFGAYGLKPEINDVTKLIEDLSLNKLLDGSYECPSLGKDKMKKPENTNDTLLSLVRNVWSILPTRRPLQSQSSAELDACISRTLGSPSSVSPTLNCENSDKLNALDGDPSSSSKDSEIASSPLNFQLCEASDVLKRLDLPPPKDLDSLLQDASKPSQNSKNNSEQQRSAKQVAPRGGLLPHFPWSQAFNGSSRTNSDAAKLLNGKTLCQGRWLRIADTTMSPPTSQFTNLDSLTFNQSLVHPVQNQTNTSSCHCTEASVSTFQKASSVPTGKNLSPSAEPEGSGDVQDDALSCPQLIAAAQTLCDFTIQSGNHNNSNPDGILRWPKKLSQKSMKALKSKLIEKPPERNGTIVPSLDLTSGSKNNNNHVRKDSAAEQNHYHHQQHQHHPKPSKRLKLSTMESNKKGSFPSSSSSSAIGSDRKLSSSSLSKFRNHSRMMMPPPPPKRTLQKSSTYPQKARKFP